MLVTLGNCWIQGVFLEVHRCPLVDILSDPKTSQNVSGLLPLRGKKHGNEKDMVMFGAQFG